jgi:hypothetical protein
MICSFFAICLESGVERGAKMAFRLSASLSNQIGLEVLGNR